MDANFLQSTSYLIAIVIFVWYLRKDSKDDYIKLETKINEDYLRMELKLEAWRKESNEILRAIQEEMKDFHCKIYKIENKK